MDQISIRDSHLTIKLHIQEANISRKELIRSLFKSITDYKINGITLDLAETGNVYNSLIVGTILGLCKSLIDINIPVVLINSPVINDNLTTYGLIVDRLRYEGVKIYDRNTSES